MSYKKGQKLILCRNKPSVRYPRSCDYYYGNDTKTVPLGNEAIFVREESKDKIIINMIKPHKYSSWVAHPSELRLLEGKIEKLKKQVILDE